jgi:hypothetical protein
MATKSQLLEELNHWFRQEQVDADEVLERLNGFDYLLLLNTDRDVRKAALLLLFALFDVLNRKSRTVKSEVVDVHYMDLIGPFHCRDKAVYLVLNKKLADIDDFNDSITDTLNVQRSTFDRNMLSYIVNTGSRKILVGVDNKSALKFAKDQWLEATPDPLENQCFISKALVSDKNGIPYELRIKYKSVRNKLQFLNSSGNKVSALLTLGFINVLTSYANGSTKNKEKNVASRESSPQSIEVSHVQAIKERLIPKLTTVESGVQPIGSNVPVTMTNLNLLTDSSKSPETQKKINPLKTKAQFRISMSPSRKRSVATTLTSLTKADVKADVPPTRMRTTVKTMTSVPKAEIIIERSQNRRLSLTPNFNSTVTSVTMTKADISLKIKNEDSPQDRNPIRSSTKRLSIQPTKGEELQPSQNLDKDESPRGRSPPFSQPSPVRRGHRTPSKILAQFVENPPAVCQSEEAGSRLQFVAKSTSTVKKGLFLVKKKSPNG